MERNLSAKASANGTSEEEEDSAAEATLAWAFGLVLSLLYVAGVSGNAYTLALLWRSGRRCCCCPSAFSSASSRGAPLAPSIASLALADLLYLGSIPFIVGTSLARDWPFGALGCRLLLSLDLLTMHASIFTLTLMCAQRYRAVARPLAARGCAGAPRAQGALAIGAWALSLLLALPMMLMVSLGRSPDGKRLCAPTWSPRAYRLYLSLLFGTSIVGPGLAIGALYTRLALAYLASLRRPPRKQEPRRSPRRKVLLLLLSIVLLFWACFLPFWLWQLVPLYHGPPSLARPTRKAIHYLVTCLTYSNSCINPFLYTLLTRNYQEDLRSQRSARYRFTSSCHNLGAAQRQPGEEGLAMATLHHLK
ncbi:urotensin-2 receptor-like [Anolis carolinensis]|uniref:urotensin-2 receptor-like n=1 Tax=Anolis carolinensis TaxID=28377 RepID=UPI002F2B3550